MKYNELLIKLLPVVYLAGDTIMNIYKQSFKTNYKEDGSPVTIADKKAEKIILSGLKPLANGIDIISEENSESHKLKTKDKFFLVDPLDGTKEFLKKDGKGSFTVNIALIENGVPIFGIVYAPALERMFSGIIKHGAVEYSKKNKKTISVRKIPNSGPVAVASNSHRDSETDVWLREHKIVETISIGSSLKFCLLATGEADVYPRFGPTMEWDTAAGDAILRAAGGTMKNPDGSNFIYGKKGFLNSPFIAFGKNNIF